MKKAIFTILFFGVLQFAFSQEEKIYDYATLTMTGWELTMSTSNGVNEKISYKGKEDAGAFKFTFLFKKVNEFEEKGWEVISSGFSGGTFTSYFILRKEKE